MTVWHDLCDAFAPAVGGGGHGTPARRNGALQLRQPLGSSGHAGRPVGARRLPSRREGLQQRGADLRAMGD